jgi:DNA-binding MarR family transcriptional regulator
MPGNSLRLDTFIPFRLSFTTNLVSASIAEAYETMFGITIPEWRVMAWAAEKDGITQQQICAHTRMDKVTVSRAAISLAERGLLDRTPNPDDRRSHLLVLSAQGRDLYSMIAPKALELEKRIFANFDGPEIETFVSMLRRIDAIVLGLAGEPVPGVGHRRPATDETPP